MSRSQSRRSSSVSTSGARCYGLLADLALSPLQQARDVATVHEEGEGRERGEQQRLGRRADEPKDHRSGYGGDERGERGIAECDCERDPDHRDYQRHLPRDCEQDPKAGGNALAALELEPDRKEVAQKRAQSRDQSRIMTEPPRG